MRGLQRAPLLLEVSLALPEIGYSILVVGLHISTACSASSSLARDGRGRAGRLGFGSGSGVAGRASFRCGFASAGFPDPPAARFRRGAGPSSSSGVAVRRLGTGLPFGSAAICSSLVPRRRRTTSPGLANGSRVSSSSVTTSAMPRANRSASTPHALSASFWLLAAT